MGGGKRRGWSFSQHRGILCNIAAPQLGGDTHTGAAEPEPAADRGSPMLSHAPSSKITSLHRPAVKSFTLPRQGPQAVTGQLHHHSLSLPAGASVQELVISVFSIYLWFFSPPNTGWEPMGRCIDHPRSWAKEVAHFTHVGACSTVLFLILEKLGC